MNIVVVLAVIAALFALAFFTRRRFGLLGLALTAGATLSQLWTSTLTPYVQQAGIQLLSPPLENVVAAVVTLLPAVLLLFSGPKYGKMWQKVIGAAAFALLAVAFLLEPLGGTLTLNGTSQSIYSFLVENRNWIITGGILYALFDLLTAKTPKVDKEKS